MHADEVVVLEWEIAGKQYEENNAARPEVNLGAVVVPVSDNLRSHVGRRSARCVELVGAGEGTDPKVGDFVVVKEKVFR